ncbi:MAG: hypothetical protein ACREQX_16260 [Candidatus Binataceae bacterium]
MKTRRANFILTGTLLVAAGCAAHSPPPPVQTAQTASVNRASPQVITDLSSLSSSNSVAQIRHENQLVAHAASPLLETTAPANNAQNNINRLFLSNPESARYTDTVRPPGEAILLNAKARQYSEFAHRLANQTLVAVQDLEPKRIAHGPMPDNLRPVVLTAVMNSGGHLKELIIDQRSGVAAVDKLVIDGCKKGLWSRNSPAQALTDGQYRLRIEAMIINYTYNRNGIYTFNTRLGLGLL